MDIFSRIQTLVTSTIIQNLKFQLLLGLILPWGMQIWSPSEPHNMRWVFLNKLDRDVGVELTGYYKDIRNLNSTEIKNSFIAGDRYGVYVNKDHANSKGITMAISKRSKQNFSGNLDYTYSISEGNASDPTAAFYDEQSDIEPEKMLVPLDWDQRHTINGTATYHPTKIFRS